MCFAGKTVIKISANGRHADAIKKPLFLVVQQNNKSSISMPQFGKKTVLIRIEGFTPDGRLISQTKTVVAE